MIEASPAGGASPMDDAQLQAYAKLFYYQQAIGPRSEYYVRQFEKFERAGDRWVATWNWPAFFFSSAWFAYRRMSARSLLNFLLPVLFILTSYLVSEGVSRFVVAAGYFTVAFVFIPMYANLFYYRYLKAQIAGVAVGADDKAARKSLRPPSFGSGVEAALTGVFVFVIPWFLLTAPAMYADYTPRAKISETVSLAASLKQPIAAFYEEHKRLPAPHEAEKFRVNAGKYAQSVAYDAGKRMILVTLGDRFKDQRFAIHAEEKDGTIAWTCRTIDVDPKYLPAACR
jgi:type IV pilus assembly protein PilA